MTRDLLSPVFEGGLKNVHFFHGRLLTARDMEDESRAHRRRSEKLAGVVGHGVVRGLRVTLDPTSGGDAAVVVSRGLALDREGHCLELAGDETVYLARQAADPPRDAGRFATCRPPSTVTVTSGHGIYLLALTPASRFEERAPQSGLGGEIEGCGSRYLAEGVRFRLVRFDPIRTGAPSAATAERLGELFDLRQPDGLQLSMLRNLLAHTALGTEELDVTRAALRGWRSDAGPRSYGIADRLLDAGDLEPCDVPLAVLYWTRRGVAFVDRWAVRRRPVPLREQRAWPSLVGERRLAEAEAAYLQFQEQVDDLRFDPAVGSDVTIRDCFRFLPPAGLVPLGSWDLPMTFLHGLTRRGIDLVDEGTMEAILARSAHHRPIDLDRGELLWLYQPRQEEAENPIQRTVLFTTSAMPHLALPRFGVARFDQSRYDVHHQRH